VKAPFEQRNGGREWMWIRVTAWNGVRLRGILENDPDNVPDLKRGAGEREGAREGAGQRVVLPARTTPML